MLQIPLQITFRDMDPSEAVEADVRAWADKIERHARRLTSCRVLVESPHKHHQHGRRFRVRVELSLPGEEIVVARDPGRDPGHEDVYVAIRDAFRAAQRRLDEHRARALRERHTTEKMAV